MINIVRNMEQKNNYSIIIPHHNIPDLLERCLNTIPVREDIQIIVVDDKSDEKYISRLLEIQRKFPYTNFIYNDVNGYGGSARNKGLSFATGKYVLFADADDYFTSDINSILDAYVDTIYDIVFFKVKKIEERTGLETPMPHYVNDYIDKWDCDKDTAELYLRYIWGEPWGKIIRRQLIEDYRICFDEVRINNDTTFSYLVGYYAKKIMIDKRSLYTYIVRKNSTSRQRDLNRLYIKIDVFGRSELFFRQHNIPLHEFRQLNALSYFLKYLSLSGFKKGFSQLLAMGFDIHDIQINYAKAVCRRSFIAPIWSFLFAPDLKIKLYCIELWFSMSWPRFIKYKLLKKQNNELRIS